MTNLPLYILMVLGVKKILEKSPNVDQTLKFKNGKFTILQLTDFHYGESEEKDKNNDKIHRKLLDYINPDLVVNTGDLISGYAWDKKEKDFYYKNWKRYTDLYQEKKLLYAYALGNHDHQGDYNYQ